TNDRIGRKKVESAAETVRALNPDVKVIPHEEMLTEDNVERIIAGYDVILDGTDTFETRYTLNDAAVRAGITVIHASVFRFEG
ncbi:HesA/MoeB/ThiF family protein, partial [Lacticaseibacillus paracasei]